MASPLESDDDSVSLEAHCLCCIVARILFMLNDRHIADLRATIKKA